MSFFTSFDKIMRITSEKDCIIGGFNVYGIDDATAVVFAAEELNVPVVLMVGDFALQTTSLENWADILNALAERASVPVCVHFDHAVDEATVVRAVKAGYDSVMFNGSRLPLEENISITRRLVNYIHASGLIAEAGVGYKRRGCDDNKCNMTNPSEAKQFVEETRADWVAVSVSDAHEMKSQTTATDFELLEEIQAAVSVPLVIRDYAGISAKDMKKLRKTSVSKINIDTALRMEFGKTLHEVIKKNAGVFDRCELLKEPVFRLQTVAKTKMQLLGLEGFFN